MVDQQSSIRPGDHHALLLEADDAYRATMAECLRLGGCSTDQVATLDSAFAALDDRKYDLVVWGGAAADVRHHGGAAAGVRARTKAPLLVVDGGFDAPEVAIAVRAEHWLPKPFVPGALVLAVRSALRTPAESEALRQWHELSPAKRRWSAAGGLTGNGKRLAAASSQADDVTLFGPDGGSGRGCDAVGSQLRLAAENARKRPKHPRFQMDQHHFKEVMEWILAKGRDDSDASAIALSLAKQIVDNEDPLDDFVKPL